MKIGFFNALDFLGLMAILVFMAMVKENETAKKGIYALVLIILLMFIPMLSI